MNSSLLWKTVRPTGTPQGQVVLLHGWGANCEDLLGIVPPLDLPHLVFCSPDAPMPHPHAPMGRMWYDLESPQWTGLSQSRSQLLHWLTQLEQSTQVPLHKTVLVGFSQGAAMTLDVGLRLPVAGLVMLSGYLHPELVLDRPAPSPPVLVIHGSFDAVVPIAAAQDTQDFLQEITTYTYRELAMGHEINLEAIAAVRQFIATLLPLSQTIDPES
ncbi:MAG: alpha/beta hydrolase [Prochlorothrix sp.]